MHITKPCEIALPGKHTSGNMFTSPMSAAAAYVYRVFITSEAFKTKMQPARHRMVYALLKEDMAREGGIHALQLKTQTPEEEARTKAREDAEKGESIAEIERS
jgi:BolA protein